MINVEQSLNEIRQTLITHNIQHQKQQKKNVYAEDQLPQTAQTKSTLKTPNKRVPFVRKKFDTVFDQRKKRVSFMTESFFTPAIGLRGLEKQQKQAATDVDGQQVFDMSN